MKELQLGGARGRRCGVRPAGGVAEWDRVPVDRRGVEQIAQALELTVAPFDVAVAVVDAPGFGGWAVQVSPPTEGMAPVEVLVPAGTGGECLISAGSGNAFMYSGADLPDVVDDALPILQAAASGALQTAGETLYLAAGHGWTIRGGFSVLPRPLRRPRRYDAYPAADPPPTVTDLVGAAVGQVLLRFDADVEEFTDGGGWGVRVVPTGGQKLCVVIHAGQDEDEAWSRLEVVIDDDRGIETRPDVPAGVLGARGRQAGDSPRWEVDDWGDPGAVATRMLVFLTQIASGDVRVATDGVGTVWTGTGGRWQEFGPRPPRRRWRPRRPYRRLSAWPPRPS